MTARAWSQPGKSQSGGSRCTFQSEKLASTAELTVAAARSILAVVNLPKTPETNEAQIQSTPPASQNAKPVSAEQLVVSGESNTPPVSPPAASPDSKPDPSIAAAPNKGGRPKGSKDTKPRKPKSIPIRGPGGKIIGNVPAPAGTPPPEPKAIQSADFSDVEQLPADPIAGDLEDGAGLDTRATAEVSFDTGAGILTMIFGNEWQPKGKDEREQVVSALERYFNVKGVRDIPPGVALTLVLATYSVTRLKAPTTSGKLKLAWSWVKSKWHNFRARRRGFVPIIRTPDPQPTKENENATVTAASP